MEDNFERPKTRIINLFDSNPNDNQVFEFRRKLPFGKTFAEYDTEQLNMTYYYIGNCENMFDPESGQCFSNIFNDVSEFARLDELSHEEPEDSEGNGKINRDEFLAVVDITKQPLPIIKILENPDMEFYYYSNGVLVACDPIKDIHYFFSK